MSALTYGLVLSRGGDTLDLRGPAVYCPRPNEVLGAPAKSGADRVVPGSRGAVPRPRVARSLRAILPVEIDGHYDIDGSAGTLDPHPQTFLLLETVNDFLDADGICDATFHRPGGLSSLTGKLQVVDPGPPQWVAGHLVRLEVDVTLPDGRLS